MDELRNGEDNALPFARAGGSEVNLPEAQHQVDVYLNNEFVGHKTLLNQVELPDDIGDYLSRCTNGSFTTDVEGDHYKIYADDEALTHEIRTHLTSYLDTHRTGITSDRPGF